VDDKLAIWVVFGVGLSLLPILFDATRASIVGGKSSFTEAMGRGELLLVTTTLCAASAGELFGSGEAAKVSKIVSGGVAVILLILCAFFYAEVSSLLRATPANVKKDMVRNLSCALFICGAAASLSCVILSKV